MIPSMLVALVTILSSLAAVNGAVVQRDGTFTYLTPQPTTAGGSASTTQTPSSTFPPTSVLSTATTPTSTRPSVTTSGTVVPSPSTTGTLQATSFTTPPTGSTTPATTATPPATPTSGAANCNGVQQWQAAFAYVAGNQVIFNNQLFTARQWTYNNAPPSHPDQWTPNGACAQPINNQANCKGVSAWQSTTAYVQGNTVTFDNHLWSAVQWTEANAPGDASGTWKDLGACA